MENKDNIEVALFQLLMAYKYGTRENIIDMKYNTDDEVVMIHWGNDYKTYVNVACDSAAAMIYDIVKHIEERL